MIIAITGPAGSGKDTVADYIAKKLNIPHVSGGDILRDMLTSLGLDPKKSALGPFGTFLRSQYGPDIIFQRVLAQTNGGQDLVNSGLRSLSEASAVKEKSGQIVYIDAPETTRHDRIVSRQRAGEVDAGLLKQLDKQESASRLIVGENLIKVKAMADTIIVNDGSLAELYKELDDFCNRLT